MIRFLLMVWDGIHIVGEVFGLHGVKADRFADILWIALAGALLVAWTVVTVVMSR